jgi:hypothetical protein
MLFFQAHGLAQYKTQVGREQGHISMWYLTYVLTRDLLLKLVVYFFPIHHAKKYVLFVH